MTHEEALCFNDPRAVFQTNGLFRIQTQAVTQHPPMVEWQVSTLVIAALPLRLPSNPQDVRACGAAPLIDWVFRNLLPMGNGHSFFP